jgi:hypothetical protein
MTAPPQFSDQDARALGYFSRPMNADGREAHFVLLKKALNAAALQELPGHGLCPVADGSPKFTERYAWMDAQFVEKLASDPDNVFLVRNYCWFLAQREPRKALTFAERALARIAPEEARTHQTVTHLRKLLLHTIEDADERRIEHEKLRQSLRTLSRLDADSPYLLGGDLTELAGVAYVLGDVSEARAVALRCLETYQRTVGRPPGEAVESTDHHSAHTILGLLALDAGDVEQARAHLIASVELPPEETRKLGAHVLALARRLEATGDHDLVCEFAHKLVACTGVCHQPWAQAFRDEITASRPARATG